MSEEVAHIAPRLLTRAEAKRYCGGIDPERVAPGHRFGRGIRWDRALLDHVIDERSGIRRTDSNELPADGFDLVARMEAAEGGRRRNRSGEQHYRKTLALAAVAPKRKKRRARPSPTPHED